MGILGDFRDCETEQDMILVLLPTFNRFKSGYLEAAVNSILKQEYIDFILCIIDDGSSDGTLEYLSDLPKKDSRIYILRNDTNVGLPALTLIKPFLEFRDYFKYLVWAPDDCTWSPQAFGRKRRNTAHTVRRRVWENCYGIEFGRDYCSWKSS